MNDFVIISVINDIKRFINKCNKNNIDLYDIKYINNEKIIVKIKKSDLEKIAQYNYYSDIKIYEKLGIDYLKEKIINLKYLIIIFLISIIGMCFISNIILKVNVIHSNKSVRELIYNELKNNGIKKYSIKKNFNELERIKNKILDNNKENIEWISITNVGMTYVIRVEERIITKNEKKDNYCNIIAKSESLITNIYSDSGEILVSVNDLVKKGDILINGQISINEEIKGYTCANGIVMGKVWYNTNISINRIYKKKEYTGKKRINFTINNKILRSNKFNKYYKKYIFKNKLLSIYKELEYKEKEYMYNERNGIDKALYELENKFNKKLNNKGKILKTKIINKYINDKLISLDVFVVTEEEISKKIVLDISEN